jgi:hypothetical protein
VLSGGTLEYVPSFIGILSRVYEWEMRSLWIGQTTLVCLAIRMLLMPNGGVSACKEACGGIYHGFVVSTSGKGGGGRWKLVGLIVWYLWLPTCCPYHRLRIYVIRAYVHLGDAGN